MSTFGKALIAGVMIFEPSIGLVPVADAQKPIRIGASLSQTGAYAVEGQNRLRGYQLCVNCFRSLPSTTRPSAESWSACAVTS